MKDKKKVILYHGTSSLLLPQILKEGLLPRKDNGNYEGDKISHPLVYLTRYHPAFYAMNATDTEGSPAIIQVEVDLKDAYPDEDFLAIRFKKRDGLEFNPKEYKQHTEDSFNYLGNITVDKVSLGNILGYKVLPHLTTPAEYKYMVPFGAGMLNKKMVDYHTQYKPIKKFIEESLGFLFEKDLAYAMEFAERNPDKIELLQELVLEQILEQINCQ